MPPLDSEFLVQRETALQSWFSGVLPGLELGRQWGAMQAVSGDASFRRYFRVQTDTGPCILVDAPAPHEDCATFVKVAALFAASGVAVPRVLAADLSAGFMCLEDFGSSLLWTPLNQALMQSQFRQARELYQGAFAQLLLIQQLPVPQDLPRYSAALLQREMDLFGQWFCEGLLQHALKPDEQKLLAGLYAVLTQRALAQPQGVVHRDFHSRNLMYRQGMPTGVIDFQDAVVGPLSYDLVSLLRDCYLGWPKQQVSQWVLDYHQQALNAGIALPAFEIFEQDLDFMGLQRHLKVLGIFSRLWLRDGKAGYLKDIPLTWQYFTEVLLGYPEFAPVSTWLARTVTPVLPEALARAAREAGV